MLAPHERPVASFLLRCSGTRRTMRHHIVCAWVKPACTCELGHQRCGGCGEEGRREGQSRGGTGRAQGAGHHGPGRGQGQACLEGLPASRASAPWYVRTSTTESAQCTETVRHVTHGANCLLRRPEFKADDSEATTSPRPERAREQQHGRKAGDVRRRVRHGPATPARYGESGIAQTLMSRGGTAHSSGARLYPRRHRYVWNQVSSRPRLGRWTMRSERIEGHEWGTYVALGRSSGAEHGIAYRPRGPR